MSAGGPFHRVGSAAELDRLGGIAGAPAFDSALLARQAPDATWVLADGQGHAAARCSLWWTDTPSLPGARPGLIGHYGARDAAAGGRVLAHACAELAAQGCSVAIGPIDGSTWRRYRLLVERGPEPSFLLEPDNPDDWPRHFQDAGFEVVAGYFSAVAEDLSFQDPREEAAANRLARRGVQVRTLDASRAPEELRRIHALSLASFGENFLYTPIGEEEFLSLYLPLLPRVPPDLVLVAEEGTAAVGFVFGYPDGNRAAAGRPLDTAVLKTLARVPGRAWAGLGTLLVAEFNRRARALGFRRVIHALMHESNASRNLSAQWRARPVRRYALFARPLP